MQTYDLLNQIPTLHFDFVNSATWNMLIVNDYHHKFDAPNKNQWFVGELAISDDFRSKMMKYKDEAILLLSQFDEELYHKYGSKYLKIIDFDLGKIFIFKIINDY